MSTPDEQLAQAIQAIGALVNQVSSLTATVNGMQMQLGDLKFPPPPRPITPAAPTPCHPSPAHVPLPASRPFSPYYQALPPIRKEPKMAIPLPFSGKREETETFINSCHLYMSARPSEFYDEQAKVYWILSFMQSGTAQNWRNFIASHITQGRINYVTVEQFLTEIEKKFGEFRTNVPLQ